MTPRSKTIAAIASRHLNVTTLENRDSDRLDFHDCAVWNIKAALTAAYDAGRSSALQNPGQDQTASGVSSLSTSSASSGNA